MNNNKNMLNNTIEKYGLVKPTLSKEVYKIRSIKLSDEYEEKLPLLIKLYPPKKRTLKRK